MRPRTLNFVLIGEARSGASIVQSVINNHPQAACHSGLLHESAEARQRAHEAYFGKSPPASPEWLTPEISPCRYLSVSVFDNPRADEKVIGVRISYDRLDALDLYQYFHGLCRSGDFCVIHVVRNPIMCLVSRRQAEASGVWASHGAAGRRPPLPVSLRPEEATEAVRTSTAIAKKVAGICDDQLQLQYTDLCFRPEAAAESVFDFLELSKQPPVCDYSRLSNKSPERRISGLEKLKAAVPSDVRDRLNDLF